MRCVVARPDVRTRHSTQPKMTRVWCSLTCRIRLCSVVLLRLCSGPRARKSWRRKFAGPPDNYLILIRCIALLGIWGLAMLSSLEARKFSYCTAGYIGLSSPQMLASIKHLLLAEPRSRLSMPSYFLPAWKPVCISRRASVVVCGNRIISLWVAEHCQLGNVCGSHYQGRSYLLRHCRGALPELVVPVSELVGGEIDDQSWKRVS